MKTKMKLNLFILSIGSLLSVSPTFAQGHIGGDQPNVRLPKVFEFKCKADFSEQHGQKFSTAQAEFKINKVESTGFATIDTKDLVWGAGRYEAPMAKLMSGEHFISAFLFLDEKNEMNGHIYVRVIQKNSTNYSTSGSTGNYNLVTQSMNTEASNYSAPLTAKGEIDSEKGINLHLEVTCIRTI